MAALLTCIGTGSASMVQPIQSAFFEEGANCVESIMVLPVMCGPTVGRNRLRFNDCFGVRRKLLAQLFRVVNSKSENHPNASVEGNGILADYEPGILPALADVNARSPPPRGRGWVSPGRT